jgi:hypothetical protein
MFIHEDMYFTVTQQFMQLINKKEIVNDVFSNKSIQRELYMYRQKQNGMIF